MKLQNMRNCLKLDKGRLGKTVDSSHLFRWSFTCLSTVFSCFFFAFVPLLNFNKALMFTVVRYNNFELKIGWIELEK